MNCKNKDFIFWFSHVYGKKQARILTKLAKKRNEDPEQCVNHSCRSDFWNSDHDHNCWMPVGSGFQESWRS